MRKECRLRSWVALALLAAMTALVGPTSGWAQSPPPARAHVVLTREFPPLDGGKLVATLVEVTYDPGGASTRHRHPCPVIGYVLEGSVRMQVEGQPEQVYTVGQTFYESPADVHAVSANASMTAPARFLAYFVCDHQTKLSLPVSDDDSR